MAESDTSVVDGFDDKVHSIRSAKTDATVRTMLVLSLGESGDLRAIPVLRSLISEEGSSAFAASLALACFGRDAEVERILLERLGCVVQRWSVRQPRAYFGIVRALGTCGGADAASALVGLLHDVYASSDATLAALDALDSIGPAAREALERLRDNAGSGQFARWAVQLLSYIEESSETGADTEQASSS